MTNPPVPATPLDVEACVRLLLEEARYPRHRFFCNPRSAWTAGEQLMCDCGANVLADTLRALASALPGMGKAEERLRQIREQCRVIYYGTPDMYPIEHAPGANKDSWEWMMLHLDADAARAAQPQETSADAE